MTNVETVAAHVKNIDVPDELKQLSAWLVWRYEQHPNEVKARKVPYWTDGARRSGTQGSPQDRAKLVTFDVARSYAARKGFDGIGLAIFSDFGFTALDFDDCVVNGEIHPKVLEITNGTYSEYSPSGTGIRAFVKGHLPQDKDCDGKPFGIEVFSVNGYVTMTGNTTQMVEILGLENTIEPINDALYDYYEERFPRFINDSDFVRDTSPVGLTAAQIKEGLEFINPDVGYDTWLKLGMAIHHELGGSSEGFDLYNVWSSNGTKYKGIAEMQRKWSSFGRNTSGRVTTGRFFIRVANDAGASLRVVDKPSIEEFEAIKEAAETGEPSPSNLKYAPIPAAIFSNGPPPRWIIKNVLPQADVGLMVGPPGCGKSFFAVDMGLSIARGFEWRGNRVKQGRVVYIAAEGGGGVRKRLTAYSNHHQVPLEGIPFDVINAQPDFLDNVDVKELAKGIAYTGGAQMIIVDTLAQVTPGSNENSGEDMGKALKSCRALQAATGAFVMLVHHVGKDITKGARGWSGLKGAADCEITVARSEKTGKRWAKVSKQKDGDDSTVWGFDLEVISVGVDEDGDVIDSCVVVETESPTPEAKGKRRGPNQVLALESLSNCVPTNGDGISLDYLVDDLRDKMERGTAKRDTRAQRAKEALRALLEEPGIGFYYDGEHVKRVM